MKKNILLITTGGTISQTKINGVLSIDKSKTGNCLLEQIYKKNEILNSTNIDICDLFQLDSSNITPSYWKKIIDEITTNYENYDAFIVLHGTDTLSYTCAALSYALTNIDKPVIVTGAQIPFGFIGSDAELNLENAIRIATQDIIKLKGIVCVFGSHIITGTRVKKLSEFSYDAFENFNTADLGRIGSKIQFNKSQIDNHNAKYGNAKSCNDLVVLPNFAMDYIMVINEFPGLNANCFKLLVDNGIKGFVFRTYAGGNSNVGKATDTFENLRNAYLYLQEKEIPLAIISQPCQGCTTMKDYKPGQIAKQLGGVPTYDMSTESLTVKLGWLIGQNLTYDEIRKALSSNIRCEIDL